MQEGVVKLQAGSVDKSFEQMRDEGVDIGGSVAFFDVLKNEKENNLVI